MREKEERILAHFRVLYLTAVVKEIIDLFGQSCGNAIYRFQVGKICPAHGLGAAKMDQQRTFAGATHAGDFIQRS